MKHKRVHSPKEINKVSMYVDISKTWTKVYMPRFLKLKKNHTSRLDMQQNNNVTQSPKTKA